MTRQLVKKSRTDKRKRKGYKGFKLLETARNRRICELLRQRGFNPTPYMDALPNLLKASGGGKHGGRVTRRGIGKATHGFGKVMRKN